MPEPFSLQRASLLSSSAKEATRKALDQARLHGVAISVAAKAGAGDLLALRGIDTAAPASVWVGGAKGTKPARCGVASRVPAESGLGRSQIRGKDRNGG